MKTSIKFLLHKLLGFKNYLFVFSLFKIYTLKRDKNEKDFFHFLKLIPPNTAVIDIGANIGIMTVHLAREIENVNVFSFEPVPSNFNALKRTIKFFKLSNVTAFEMALGNKEEESEMVMPVISNVKMQGLSHVLHPTITENNEGNRFKIIIKTLDSIQEIRNVPKRISAIKIDVENFEFFVLDGAKTILTKHQPIVYAELWENENRTKCFQFFESLKYKTFVIADNKMVEYDSVLHNTQNFLFLPS